MSDLSGRLCLTNYEKEIKSLTIDKMDLAPKKEKEDELPISKKDEKNLSSTLLSEFNHAA